jgi:hypothetical protein
MAETVALARADADLETTALTFDRVGHALGGPGTNPVAEFTYNGGEAPYIAKARSELWRATVLFFKANLQPTEE